MRTTTRCLLVALVGFVVSCETQPTDPGLPGEVGEACYDGPEATRGKGQCRGGIRLLLPKAFTDAAFICHGQVLPSAEICNNLDDDCDGQTDEGAGTCPEVCYSGPDDTEGVGACRSGVLVALGSPGSGNVASLEPSIERTCHGEVLPVSDVCNGVDDDCNGVVDDAAIPCVASGVEVPGVDDNELEWHWLPDRLGPAGLSRDRGGLLWPCPADTYADSCAEALVGSTLGAAMLGLPAGSPVSFARVRTAQGMGTATVQFVQRFQGLDVVDGGLSVTVRTATPHGVLRIAARRRPVPDTLGVDSQTTAEEALTAAGAPQGEATSVVFVPSVNAQDQPLPIGEQRASLAWQVVSPEDVVFLHHATLAELDRRSLLEPDYAILDNDATPTLVSTGACSVPSPGGSLVCPATAVSSPPTAVQAASRAVEQFHTAMHTHLGRDGLDGDGNRGDSRIEVIFNVTGDLCPGTCSATTNPWLVSGVLGYNGDTRTANICCEPPPGQEARLLETVQHELWHAAQRLVRGRPEASTTAKDAREHAFVEATTELLACLKSADPQLQSCDLFHVGRRYSGAPFDPRVVCGCQAAGTCIPVAGVNGAFPTFALCPLDAAGDVDLHNRQALGNALIDAACRMAGCSESDCRSGAFSTCAAAAAQQQAAAKTLRLIWQALPAPPAGSGVSDAALALYAAAQDLQQAGVLELADIGHVGRALSDIGLLPWSHVKLPVELCNGLDDEQDGFVDNAAGQTSHGSLIRTCFDEAPWYVGVGECQAGVQGCSGFNGWSAICAGQVLPVAESCNGLDDDCDGQIDEGTLVKHVFDADGDGFAGNAPPVWACPGSLGDGWLHASPNNVGDCRDDNPGISPGAAESCLTPGDDNCNGVDNEQCPCAPLMPPRYCGPAIGGACLGAAFGTPGCQSQLIGDPGCSLGLQMCEITQAGDWQWTDTCSGADFGSAEVCNGLDDDCNGVVDDDVAGLAAACGYGGTGYEVCSASQVVCEDEQEPNGCGGWLPLPATPGEPCDAGLGDWAAGVTICAHPNGVQCLATSDGECVGGPQLTQIEPSEFIEVTLPPEAFTLYGPDANFNASVNDVHYEVEYSLVPDGSTLRVDIKLTMTEIGGNESIGVAQASPVLFNAPNSCAVLSTSFEGTWNAEATYSFYNCCESKSGTPGPFQAVYMRPIELYPPASDFWNGATIRLVPNEHLELLSCCSLPKWATSP